MNIEYQNKINIRTEIDQRINFAMQQNDVPVIKLVQIENLSGNSLNNLQLLIISDPPFAHHWQEKIDLIPEDSTYDLKSLNLELSPKFLGELTERIRGLLSFQLFHTDELIGTSERTVELLARDEWSGLVSLPEILAAFVMPNHPSVERILRNAADILGTWIGDPSLAGYQRQDPKHVYLMAAAIYAALQKANISYINPPASFEANGQRIRFPDRIIDLGMATCLDLAVLAAACLAGC